MLYLAILPLSCHSDSRLEKINWHVQQNFSCNLIFYESDTIKSTLYKIIRLYSKYVVPCGFVFDFGY